MHLMDSVIDAGRGLVVAINKWDGPDEQEHIKTEIKRACALPGLPMCILFQRCMAPVWAICINRLILLTKQRLTL